jgi:hypothetical protein
MELSFERCMELERRLYFLGDYDNAIVFARLGMSMNKKMLDPTLYVQRYMGFWINDRSVAWNLLMQTDSKRNLRK